MCWCVQSAASMAMHASPVACNEVCVHGTQHCTDTALSIYVGAAACAYLHVCARVSVRIWEQAEGAGACPVAAALQGVAGAKAKKVVCVVSGGGLDKEKLVQILSRCSFKRGLTPKQMQCRCDQCYPSWSRPGLTALGIAAAVGIVVFVAFVRPP